MSSVTAHPRVALFGHFGSANTGNESTLLAVLARLRRLQPGAELRCICTDPAAVTARDGIEATPITMRTRRIWDRALPLPVRIPMVLAGLLAELREYGRALRMLSGTSTLLVPGTGLVTDAYGLARWGPYSLFKWTLAAKLRGARVVFLSVGAGPVDGLAGRVLVRATLSLADYRSYRDQASKDHLTAIGFDVAGDRVYPDLVFGLPEQLLPADRRRAVDRPPAAATTIPPASQPLVVGIGLMLYAERYSTRHPRPETHRAYLECLADFTLWLLEHGHSVRLLLGDGDTLVIEQFRATLAARAGGSTTLTVRVGTSGQTPITQQPVTSPADLLAEIAACDAVVATRFHNILMAMLLGRPVIAISFHHKCASLMRQMGMSEYIQDIHALDTTRLIEQFMALERDRDTVKAMLGQGVEIARGRLEEQYQRLFAAG